MFYQASIVLYLTFSTTLAVNSLRSLPLFGQDPHDVQYPSFPPPSCSPALNQGFDISTTIHAIAAFCTSETGVVSAMYQQPISRTYASAGGVNVIRLSISWDNTGVCRRSQLSLSPVQNSGRNCETIFRMILLGCK